jgi:hypothetical protein
VKTHHYSCEDSSLSEISWSTILLYKFGLWLVILLSNPTMAKGVIIFWFPCIFCIISTLKSYHVLAAIQL